MSAAPGTSASRSAQVRAASPAEVVDLGWHEAREIARGAGAPPRVEEVQFGEALRRVLAAPLVTRSPMPAFDTAAMDGYAVSGAGPWRVVGRVLAGSAGAAPSAPALTPGIAMEIATGAVVPRGASAVLPYERCEVDAERLLTGPTFTGPTLAGPTSTGPTGPRTHIRRAGEDAAAGTELLAAGRVVTAAVLGVAAQCGLDTLTVHRRPRVSILTTGDEVVAHGLPRTGQVRDALTPIVEALVHLAGGAVGQHVYVPDDPDALFGAVRDAADADVVAVTGSSSAGAADHLHAVLDRLGARLRVDRVRCRPGRPQALAETRDGRWIVSLPGNPFAGLVAGLTLLEPLLAALSGRAPAPGVLLPVHGPTPGFDGEVRFVCVRVEGASAQVVGVPRPASLRGAAQADAVAVLESGWTSGQPAELIPLP